MAKGQFKPSRLGTDRSRCCRLLLGEGHSSSRTAPSNGLLVVLLTSLFALLLLVLSTLLFGLFPFLDLLFCFFPLFLSQADQILVLLFGLGITYRPLSTKHAGAEQ